MRSKRLARLRDLLGERTGRARAAWQAAQAEAARRRARLEELGVLAREYSGGLARAGAGAAAVAVLQDYRQFIDRLDALAVQQRSAIAQADTLVVQRLRLWRAAARREQALVQLIAREDARLATRERRRDARAEDEWNATRAVRAAVD